MARLEELEKRVANLEYCMFGMTRSAAKEILRLCEDARQHFSTVEFDGYYQANKDSIMKAERLLGVGAPI